MAKKGKDEAPNPHSVSNRDIIQRLNFLYQAGVYLNTISSGSGSGVPHQDATPSSTSGGQCTKPNKKRKVQRKATTSDLAKAYISSMKVVGQKTTVKLDPAVKRTICKGCDTILIPGSTASVRVKKSTSHGHAMVYTCIGCRTTRRIPAPPTLAADVPMDAPLSHVSTSTSLPVTKPPNSDPTSVTAMDVITAVGDLQPSGNSSGQVRSRKKAAVHRRPPLFVRDVGHVVFCGNERLDNMGAERGDGIYIT